MSDIFGYILLALFVLAIILITAELWMEILALVVIGILEIAQLVINITVGTVLLVSKVVNVARTLDDLFLYTLFVGCLITSIGIGISPTESSIVFGLGVALMILSSIAIRVQENREFTNPKHNLAIYQSMKIRSGLINLGLGIMCCIIAIAITGIMTINIIHIIPGLALVAFGGGKVMKYSFIKRSSSKQLSFAIKIKYFYRDTSELIAKVMNFKMSQKTQQVAA